MSLFFFQLYSSCTLSCSLRLNFARSRLIFCLVRSVSTSEARSSAASSSCSINRSVSDNISGWRRLLYSIFGKSHQRRLPYKFPTLSSTRLGDNSLLSEKRWLFFSVFQRAHPKSTWLFRDYSSELYLNSDLERSHPVQNGKPVFVHFLLILSQADFFVSFTVFAFVRVLLDGSR